jgi:hypothetical protein
MAKKINKVKKAKQVCLGEGEHVSASTGQMIKHVLHSKEDIEYDVTDDCIKFLLKGTGVLTHDEHDRMVFEKGSYRSYNQVEFNPLNQSISRVFD